MTPEKVLESLRFRFPWRPYQARLLSELDAHVDDDRIHIVAAPGSGKTILGLEIIRRIKESTLVLVPTLTIADQWVSRFEQDFILQSPTPDHHYDLINRNNNDVAKITVKTYQWLHQQVKSGNTAQFDRFHLFALDEAHHLTQAWWQSLEQIVRSMRSVKIIALTATPPLGVTNSAWNRYRNLCGPIDAEISIPELVKAGNLCPHQDYLYLTYPDAGQLRHIEQAQAERADALSAALSSTILLRAVLGHPFIGNTVNNLHRIHRQPDVFLSMTAYMSRCGVDLRAVYQALGFAPKANLFNATMLETLVNDVLRKSEDYFLLPGDLHRLRRLFCVSTRMKAHQFRFRHDAAVEQQLLRSRSKLDAIQRIIEQETAFLGDSLRALILTNYIRKQYLDLELDQQNQLDQIGVVPIVLALLSTKTTFAAVTGSLVIAPRQLAENHRGLYRLAVPLRASSDYVSIETNNANLKEIMMTVVKGFRQGDVATLVGTVSLLGEGWDEPEVNTLILATQTKSYVQVNQLRGRAIRVSPANPQKTANIWHLACIDPTRGDLGGDLSALKERFQHVVGLHHRQSRIENGFMRLGCEDIDGKRLETINEFMTNSAKRRDALAHRWVTALGDPGTENRDLLEERLRLPARRSNRLVNVGWRSVIKMWFARLFYRDSADSVIRIASALLTTLQQLRIVDAKVETRVDLAGDEYVVILDSATKYEQEQYFAAAAELFGGDPPARFLIHHRYELYNVPSVFNTKKKADMLMANWQRQAGSAQLIYARSAQGRQYWQQLLVRRALLGNAAPVRQAVWITPADACTARR